MRHEKDCDLHPRRPSPLCQNQERTGVTAAPH